MKTALLLMSTVALLAGCASSKSGDVYTREQARYEHTVRVGMVESVREVQLEGTRTPVGGLAGAAVGGIAGSSVGGGKGAAIAAVVGAVAGSLLGSNLEEGATRKPALEITVRLDSGQMLSIVQEGHAAEFRPGDRVRVLSGRGESRVTRY